MTSPSSSLVPNLERPGSLCSLPASPYLSVWGSPDRPPGACDIIPLSQIAPHQICPAKSLIVVLLHESLFKYLNGSLEAIGRSLKTRRKRPLDTQVTFAWHPTLSMPPAPPPRCGPQAVPLQPPRPSSHGDANDNGNISPSSLYTDRREGTHKSRLPR